MATISTAAQKIIANYLSLPFSGVAGVRCPYYNNRRLGVRGGLRAAVGKGSPGDIVEEALILSLHDKIDLRRLNAEELTKFLVDHRLGVDCSALAYYALDAELKARGRGGIKKQLRFPGTNLFRKLLIALRAPENTSVKTFAHPANTSVARIEDIRPGDLIIMLGSGPEHDYDHVLVAREIDKNVIHYIHSLAWTSDGRYGHGARQGKIIITNPAGGLLDQQWEENGKTGEENETLGRAKSAKRLEIRRLKIFNAAETHSMRLADVLSE